MRVFLDMDGVLSDFIEGSLVALGEADNYTKKDVTKWDYYKDWGYTTTEFWNCCRGHHFWETLPKFTWADDLVQAARELDPDFRVCTMPSLDKGSYTGKIDWLQNNLKIGMSRLIFMRDKPMLSKPGRLLIDDNPKFVERWEAAGGQAILFNCDCTYNDGLSPEDTLLTMTAYKGVDKWSNLTINP